MEAERCLPACAAAAGDKAASLRARLADAEADAAALRARVERLEREAAERDELLTALLAATSRAGDSGGAGGGPLLRARNCEEEEEQARHDTLAGRGFLSPCPLAAEPAGATPSFSLRVRSAPIRTRTTERFVSIGIDFSFLSYACGFLRFFFWIGGMNER